MSTKYIGCSQEHHLMNCAHFGYSGAYLSEHLKTCPCSKSNTAVCNCNPTARKMLKSDQWEEYTGQLGDWGF